MKKRYDFEYIIIGGGPAGIATALTLAKSKKRIAIIEKNHLGGTNINDSDLPFSEALDFSHSLYKLRHSPNFKTENYEPDFSKVLKNRNAFIKNSRANLAEILKANGIAHIEGEATFLDPHTISLKNHQLTSETFILATGSKLKTNNIIGTDSVNFLTPKDIVKLDRLPKIILVIGGGPTGCEITSYLAELGVKVILMESEKHLLPNEDKEISDTISEYFKNELNVIVLPNSKVLEIKNEKNTKQVVFKTGRSEKSIHINNIVLATGYEPILDYDLKQAKVKFTDSGILVDHYFKTSAKNIYAVGDAIKNAFPDSSTLRSDYEGTFLAINLLNKSKNLINYDGFCRTIKTYPKVVSVGPTEEDLKKAHRSYKKSVIHFKNILDKPLLNSEYGFVKLIADRSNRLIAGSVVSPNADELAAELSLIIRHHLPAVELASTPHSFDNYSYALKLAAKKLLAKK